MFLAFVNRHTTPRHFLKGDLTNICLLNSVCVTKLSMSHDIWRSVRDTKVCIVKSYDFSSSHVWMWELDYKESWALKNRCFQTVVLEKTLESPSQDSKEIKLVNPKGNKPWMFVGWWWSSNTFVTWCRELTHCKSPDTGKDWKQKERGAAEDKMARWHHWLNGHEFE